MSPADDASADELIIVARAVRTRGLKGELVAELLTDFPERFEKVSTLVGVSPEGQRKELELEGYWFQNERVILKFKNYDSIESANALVGFVVGVPESERVELSDSEFYEWQLSGCLVENTEGQTIGTVREVMRTGGVELLVVDGGAQHEYLIPMAGDIVLNVDIPGKKILIDPPEGLLEL
ncbi:MAG TPA: ribosome maturation factor RimM [Pyrinomonadaceae bacterium]|nr:ribosome maturation factor RimM [Pyrinomonadaceae bacterium]